MTPRITWWAVGQHAIIGAGLGLIAGTIFGPLGAWIAAPLALVGFAAREAWTAADRWDATFADGFKIVLEGEPGFSAWNLRLQAIAGFAGALPIAILAESMWS